MMALKRPCPERCRAVTCHTTADKGFRMVHGSRGMGSASARRSQSKCHWQRCGLGVVLGLFGVGCTRSEVAEVATGSWVNVTPAGFSMDHSIAHGDNYGVQDILVNPKQPGELFAFSCYEGVWKSGDYGVSWSKVSAAGGPLDHGKAWGSVIAPDASYMLSCQ